MIYYDIPIRGSGARRTDTFPPRASRSTPMRAPPGGDIYTSISISLSLYLSLSIYIYIYIHGEREREREERERERDT